MTKTKGIAIRLDDELFNKIEQHQTPRSELIRTAIYHYLNKAQHPQDTTQPDADLSEDLYQEIYNTLYNTEVQPLKEEIQYHQRIVNLLERQLHDVQKDKQFLQEQLHAQTVLTASKIPWFQNIKSKLLKQSRD
jgi:metal-responsive CopG/Arc/MetJ family transcriptional regulator